jgi:alpha-galactosidase
MRLVALAPLAATWATPARAAATDVTISTSRSAPSPRIHAPSAFSARPGTSLVYAVPATGDAPLTFSAQGLPAGLSLEASSGIFSGTMPAAGDYPVTVTVRNSAGSASAMLTLVSGETLSITPPLGWNSYDSFGGTVTEEETLSAARALKTRLQPFGWSYVVVDYLWYDGEQDIDGSGRYLPSPARFPSARGATGFKPLADRVHAQGLQFGIHIMRGVPRKSVSARSPIAGSSYTAADAVRAGDACPWDSHMWGVRGDTPAGRAWYDALFAQYAEWGIDFVKVDDMVSGGNYHQDEVDAIRGAIDKSGRSIVLSLSPGPMQTRDAPNLNTNANMWRMVNDFWDTRGLSSLDDEFAAAGSWQAVQGLTVGHWPDADMLPLGYLGPRCPVHGAGPTALSHNQQVLVMTLWSILPSPLMFGGNVPALATDSTGTFTSALLTNEEVLAINQDGLGARAKRLRQEGATEVWTRALSRGAVAVALINRAAQDAPMAISFTALGVSGTNVLRDVWRREEVKGATTELSATVPHESALLFTISPPRSPDAGADGDDDGGDAQSPGDGGRADRSDATGEPGDQSDADGGASDGGANGGCRASTASGAPMSLAVLVAMLPLHIAARRRRRRPGAHRADERHAPQVSRRARQRSSN